MKIHERELVVNQARAHFGSAIIELCKEYDLTEAELLGLLLDESLSVHKYILRAERHPDNPSKPSGIE